MGSRTNKTGIRTGSETSIEIDFYYHGVRCRERIKLPPTEKNIKYCRKWKSRIEHEIATNQFEYKTHFPESPRAKLFAAMPGDKLTVKVYLESWLANEKSQVTPSTWRGYDKIVRGHLISAFGDYTLTDLRRKHVKDWTISKNLSPKTLGNVLSPLRIALDDAVHDEIIDQNPLAGWKIKRRRTPGGTKLKARQIDPFSNDERNAILAKLDGQGHNFLLFAFWTGLRTSELCALDWNDIDWVRGIVRVTKALTQGMSEPEEGTKTLAGTREVKLLPPALAALQSQKTFTYLKGQEVFQDPRTEERWTGDQPVRKTLWMHALKRAGVRYRNPYQTRHTYASMMLMAGEHIMWVSKQLGHTDWAFTARTYGRWIPDDAPEAGQKAVAAWSTFGQRSTLNH